MNMELIKNWNPCTCPWCRSDNTKFVDRYENEEKRVCNNCNNDYLITYNSENEDIIDDITTRNRTPIVYTWKDLVLYNDELYEFEFPISGRIDEFTNGDFAYDIDDYTNAVMKTLNCTDSDEFTLYSFDETEFRDKYGHPLNYNGQKITGEAYGAYINGIPEWGLIP